MPTNLRGLPNRNSLQYLALTQLCSVQAVRSLSVDPQRSASICLCSTLRCTAGRRSLASYPKLERGAGVGRGLGGGLDLGDGVGLGVEVGIGVEVAVGVGVGVIVGVTDGVGVGDAVGVGVGDGVVPLCTSNDPTSMRPLRTRQKTGPRWS